MPTAVLIEKGTFSSCFFLKEECRVALDLTKVIKFYAPINVMPAGREGGEGRAWGGDLIVFVGPGVGHLTGLVLPEGAGIFESFFARRGYI